MKRLLPVLREFEAPPDTPHDYAGSMTTKVAKAIAGSLGKTSKMPGFSYGISAEKCQTGGKLRGVRGSVCSACYAMTDWYKTWRPLPSTERLAGSKSSCRCLRRSDAVSLLPVGGDAASCRPRLHRTERDPAWS